MQIVSWIANAAHRLEQAGVPSPKLEASLIAAHVLGKDRAWVLSNPEQTLKEQTASAILKRREQGEPLAYLLGWREFYSRRFRVGPGVLIPRQETETLIETALDWIDRSGIKQGSLLDLGTGSGCLAITMKLERPNCSVTGCDISNEALCAAHQNAEQLCAEVKWVESDLFEAFLGHRFDLILSNPPYIGLNDNLPREVAEFEPKQALFAGIEGFDFYVLLAERASCFLRRQGQLIVELPDHKSAEISNLFETKGWVVHEMRPDLGKMPRAMRLEPLHRNL